jgi:four helix bundle protein
LKVGRLEGLKVGKEKENKEVGSGEMGTIRRFEEIEAWQTARQLTKTVYELSAGGSFARDFGLRDQMRRAAVSIMSNIAEGFESRTSGLFLEFLGRAKGSAGELRAQFYVASDAGYLTKEEFTALFALCEKCSGQISGFSSYLESLPKHKRSASSPSTTFAPVQR